MCSSMAFVLVAIYLLEYVANAFIHRHPLSTDRLPQGTQADFFLPHVAGTSSSRG
jgi:hypothetical protein